MSASRSLTPGGRFFCISAFSFAMSGFASLFFEARKSVLAFSISAAVGSPFWSCISRCMRSIMRTIGSKLTFIEKPALPDRFLSSTSDCSTSKHPASRRDPASTSTADSLLRIAIISIPCLARGTAGPCV